MTVKVFTVAHVPAELAQAWLQHLRDFDTAHRGCHFEVMADAPTVPLRQAVEMLQVNPGLTFEDIIARRDPATREIMINRAADAIMGCEAFADFTSDPFGCARDMATAAVDAIGKVK